MIDNFDLIAEQLTFSQYDDAYILCVTIRRNDHKDEWNYNLPQYDLKYFYIYSVEDLYKYKNEVITLCEAFAARAYLSTGPKSMLNLYKKYAISFEDHAKKFNKDFNSNKILNNISLNEKSYIERWALDIDTQDVNYKNSIIAFIDNIEGNHDWYWFEVPTKKGLHIYTKPFNSTGFRQTFPDVSIVNNRGMLLCVPDSIMNNE